jgi:hypothetical protein
MRTTIKQWLFNLRKRFDTLELFKQELDNTIKDLSDGGGPNQLAFYKRVRNKLKKIEARLEYLRTEIEAERISTDEILELQSLVPFIEKGDVLLLQWAGVEENQE